MLLSGMFVILLDDRVLEGTESENSVFQSKFSVTGLEDQAIPESRVDLRQWIRLCAVKAILGQVVLTVRLVPVTVHWRKNWKYRFSAIIWKVPLEIRRGIRPVGWWAAKFDALLSWER